MTAERARILATEREYPSFAAIIERAWAVYKLYLAKKVARS
jgi:hypothetical protein